MTDAWIIDGVRTPFGRYGGTLARLRSDDMMAAVIAELVKRYPGCEAMIEDVIVGDASQAGEDARNVGRNAALLAGLPNTVAGISLNRLCGSGLAAAADAARSIRCDEGDLFIAGGVESMTRAPYILAKAETPFERTQPMVDSTIGWRFPNARLIKSIGDDNLPQTAENLAQLLNISREASDEFAFASQNKYEAARNDGFWDGEILPVAVPSGNRKTPPVTVSVDEHPRPETQLEKLTALRPINPNGIVTAGNASGVNDGAAALLIGSAAAAEKLGVIPTARIIATAIAGVAARTMGIGPVPATQKLLQRTGISLDEIDLIEINEAFATQVLACLKQLDIPFDDPRVNPNGGAIAIGHPLGASGARLLLTATRQLHRQGGRYALITLCIGIGQGIAMLIERA